MSVRALEIVRALHPMRRDLISDGFDAALAWLAERFPVSIHQFASGARCWTWRVPPKWTCDEAFVETEDGRRVIDLAGNPLGVASYSRAMDEVVERDELLRHVHVHAHLPDATPFVFHYYHEAWGFCCDWRTRDALTDARYRVVIRSRHEPGFLKVAEWVLPGRSDDCFVLAAHLDHAAQANDGLSGVATALEVMSELARGGKRRYTYRLLITAETIGSVAWLSANEALIPRLRGGLFLDMTGLAHAPALQHSYAGDTDADRCLRAAHRAADAGAWSAPYRGVVGNDERQFNAPGVRVPMLGYSRALPRGTRFAPFREYHSSADDLSTVSPASLDASRDAVLAMIAAWDDDFVPHNRFRGEVCLAQAGLAVDRHRELPRHRDMLRIIDCIDGRHSVAAIAERLDVDLGEVRRLVAGLESTGLIAREPPPVASGARSAAGDATTAFPRQRTVRRHRAVVPRLRSPRAALDGAPAP